MALNDGETSLGNCDRDTSCNDNCHIRHHSLGDVGRGRVILLYIDQGMGLLALQVLGASFLGMVFVFRRTLRNIATFIKVRLWKRE